MPEEKGNKVTIELPAALHKAAKIAAVNQGTTLRQLVIEALEARLKTVKR